MAEEMMMRTGLSGLFNSAETWVAVAYVLGMFAVLAFRPHQIGKPHTFRFSYIMFALYFIVPSAINGILYLAMMDSGFNRGGGGNWVLIGMQLTTIIGRVLLGLSVVLALSSLKRHVGTGEQE